MNNWVVILYMVTVLVKGLGQSSTHDLPWESTGNYVYYKIGTVTTSYIWVLCGISYIYHSWEFSDLKYNSYHGFSRTYYTYYDSTGPFIYAMSSPINSHKTMRSYSSENISTSCVNLSTFHHYDPQQSFPILRESSP